MSLLNWRQNSATRAEADGSTGEPSVATVLKALRIDGPISALEDMYVDAELYGPITSDSKVTIGPHGIVHGAIKAREVLIFGRTKGDIEATEKVALGAGADVRGDIYTIYISLDEKAYFKGSVACSLLRTQVRPFPPARESGTSDRESRTA